MSDINSGDPAPSPSLTLHAAALRETLCAVLRARADSLWLTLPPRPATPAGRYAWWRALDSGQSRQVMLVEHLDVLCQHLAGRPALGYDPHDPLPREALEAADGFTTDETAQAMDDYRRALRRAASAHRRMLVPL